MADHIEFEVLSLFPDLVDAFFTHGLIGKAREDGIVGLRCTDPREFTEDRHRTVDDSPFGGGAGMVMKPGPIVRALESIEAARGPMHKILVTPAAPRFDQPAAARLATLPRIGIICGRYEGIDTRVREHFVDECLSLGDFVLNGGEVAAVAIIEAVARLVPGVLGNPDSTVRESFATRSLEHAQYTRPAEFRGIGVPPVLLGGDHEAIARWRRRSAARRTLALRPDLCSRPPGSPTLHVAAPRDVRDLRKNIERLTRHSGERPWVLGLGPTGQPGADAIPLLCAERSPDRWPHVLVVAGSWPEPLVDAEITLEGISPEQLAKCPRLIDIAQPEPEVSAQVAPILASALGLDGERS